MKHPIRNDRYWSHNSRLRAIKINLLIVLCIWYEQISLTSWLLVLLVVFKGGSMCVLPAVLRRRLGT